MQAAKTTYPTSPSICGGVPSVPGRQLFAGQEGGEASLQQVGMAADGVGGVAVVGALPVEAEVPRRRDEEGLQQVSLGQGVDVPKQN